MKPRRILLILAGVGFAGLALAAGLAFHPGVQTWAVRRALAARPELGATIESVRVRPGRVHAEGIRIRRGGATIAIPSADVSMPVLAAARGRVGISRLVAKGWRVDLAEPASPAAPPASPPAPGPAGAGPAAPARRGSPLDLIPTLGPVQSATGALQAFFHSVKLPVDLAVESVDLEGEIAIPAAGGESRSEVRVIVTGGDLGASRVSAFAITGYAVFASNAALNALSAKGSLELAMDSPRTFSRAAARLDVEATGERFPDGTRLTIDAGAGRAESGDSYTVRVESVRDQLLAIQGRYLVDTLQPGPKRLAGVWKLDMRDSDLAPFAFGFPVPEFSLVGEGSFQADPAAAEVSLSGSLNATADRLGAVSPRLGALGAVTGAATFDLSQRARTMRVASLGLEIGSTPPVAIVRALQAFEFDIDTGIPRAADPAKELVSLDLRRLPAAWVRDFVPGITIGSADITGGFALGLRENGAVFRSTREIAVSRLAVSRGDAPLVSDLDLVGNVAADYSADGWQAEFRGIEVRSAGAVLLRADGRAGRLAGDAQPVKLTGQFGANVPAILRQPAANGGPAFSSGRVEGTFSASLGALRSLQLRLAAADLAVVAKNGPVPLPGISADARIDMAPDGAIALNLPLTIERAGRKSDMLVDGSIRRRAGGTSVSGRVSSEYLSVDDFSGLGALFAGTGNARSDAKPAWAGIVGEVALALKKVSYGKAVEASDVGGWIRFEEGGVRFDQVRAGVGNGSHFSLTGGVLFDPGARLPYSLKAAVALSDFEVGPAFRAVHPDRPAGIEGRFTITSQLQASGATPGALAAQAKGEVQLISRSGSFRLLRVDLSDKVDAGQTRVASVGSFIGAVTGRERIADYANMSRIVSGIAGKLSDIPFHQLNITLARDGDSGFRVHDLTLIAPEVRLQGTGRIRYREGESLVSQPMDLQLQLGARAELADLMRRAGLLSGLEDSLGYASFSTPLTVKGTLADPDAGPLRDRLIDAAGASLIDVLRR